MRTLLSSSFGRDTHVPSDPAESLCRRVIVRASSTSGTVSSTVSPSIRMPKAL